MDKRPEPPTAVNNSRFFYGYVIIGVGFLCLALMWGTMVSFGLFLKPMSAEFGWNRAIPSGAYAVAMFSLGIAGTITGRVSDRYGPKMVLTVGAVLLGLAFILMSGIQTLWQLYLVYGLMVGLGLSSGFVPLSSAVARWFYRRRGLMTGLLLAGFGAANFIGPPVSNMLINAYGWRQAYLILGIATLVLLAGVAQLLRRDPSEAGRLPYGEASEVEAAQNGIHYSTRDITRSTAFWWLLFLNIFFGIGQMAVTVHMAPFATDLGLSSYVAANIVAVIGISNIAGRIGMGSAIDRFGSWRTLTFSAVVVLASLAWLIFADQTWMLFALAIIFGIGTGGVPAVMSPVVADIFGLKSHGAVLGMTALGWGIGSAAGPIIAGYIFDVTASYQFAFILFAVLGAANLPLAFLLKPKRR